MADIYKVFQRTPDRVRPGNPSLIPTHKIVGSAPHRVSYDKARDNVYTHPEEFEPIINQMMIVLN